MKKILASSMLLFFSTGLFAALPVVPAHDVLPTPHMTMASLTDETMGEIDAQGLFFTDKITGSELAGANAYSTPFTFYRMGLDGIMEMNLNLSKLQLGCGGINDFLAPKAGCDIDIDYASLMGRDGYNIGAPMSAFKLDRPYMEFAIKNDGDATQREVAGIKIGSAVADGGLSAGRRYANGQTNQENMFKTGCNTTFAYGDGALGCHSGINSVSGFLGTELSIAMRVQADICTASIRDGECRINVWPYLPGLSIGLDAWGCTGRLTITVNSEVASRCGSTIANSLFVDLAGTRMNVLGLQAARLNLEGASGISNLLTEVLQNAYASMDADLRLAHGLTFENTSDFYLSLQREPISYPRFTKRTIKQDLTGSEFDSCNTGYATPRCYSAYNVAANTGWWLNAPSVKLLNVRNDEAKLGILTIADALELLAAPGYLIANPEFNLTPNKNCYGASRFC